MEDNKLLPELSQNLLEILNDEEYYDVTIEVEIFQIILRYKIYSGRISLKECDTSDIIKILVAGSELGLQELITYLQFFLIETKSNWMEQNFNLIYQTSYENNSFLEFQKYCTNIITKKPNKLFKSINSSTPENLLVSLIQSDILQMNEIEVWKHVLEWKLAQNSELPSDLTNFSKENFKTLKNNIHQCIPFIRFYNLTSDEFSDEILPYKKILPKELYKDLLKYYLNSNNQSIKKSEPRKTTKEINIDSKIITFQHARLILKWIDRLEITDEIENEYKFKLLFRGSRDGFEPEKFHEICDNQTHTVVVIKVKDSNEILGGYNPIAWVSVKNYCESFRTTKDSFIFSFKNGDKNDSFILSRVKDENYATYNYFDYGPSFGNGDLDFSGNHGSCSDCDYEKQIRETNDDFFVEEYEVFQIML
ncbi:carbohydrate-binding module family 13 protein [Rhizophagus clarus]|uniref:Carbohydrate-binding module family 13 protein n=1 Tax=Rhizophagus clarus TaxID=94130 RepID=A0A8H3MA09_9GLOM|nr:carbohydrate-binding module family 13 protein [Rhizophagus clarus]